MRIASIDPGEKTGVIFFDSRGKVVLDSFTERMETSYKEVLQFQPETVIIESQPEHSDLNSADLFYYNLFLKTFACVSINPGNWKPVANLRHWGSKFPDRHQKDAYNILRYWYFWIHREDIGDAVWINLG